MTRIGAEEFKQRVTNKLKEIDRNIKDDDLYFQQNESGYYLEYCPKYPWSSPDYFFVYQDLAGSISVHGNMEAIVPTIKHYNDIDDFESNI